MPSDTDPHSKSNNIQRGASASEEGVLDRVDVVIPSIKSEVQTTNSLPDGVTVHIERDGSLNEARNRGVQKSSTGPVVILDDDVEFPAATFASLVAMVDENTLVGLADWDFGYLAGRCLVFYKSLWEDVDGFDERLGSHMGDTQFALAAKCRGYDLERIPREVLYHEPHSRSITTWDRVWRLAYLALRYPGEAPTLAKGTLP